IIRGSPIQARIIPMINKIDREELVNAGMEIAKYILATNHQQIERVVLGRVQLPKKIRVVTRKKTE
ncbi:hypothetical protein ACFLV0_04635, partial [Chloroflexota bacterium]